MRHTASSSHRQVKALFFILLLAGHDAVRVGQEVEWSKSKWNQLHADCSWSLVKGCSEGCVRKRMPLDLTPGESCRHTNAYLLENQGLENYHAMIEILIEQSQEYSENCQKVRFWNGRCRRREAQMSEAFQFIIRAFMNKTFTATLDESEKATLNDGFQKVLENLASSQDEAESMAELFKKMKCQKSEFLQDPKKTLASVTGLSRALLSDSPDAKQRAKLQIEAMPESCSPVSAEEEAEGMVKLKDLKKEFEQEEGEVSAALDELDADIDHVVEEEANETENADSALQVGLSDSSKAALAPPKKNKRPPLLPVLLATATTVGVMALFIYAAVPALGVIVVTAGFWLLSSAWYCSIRSLLWAYSEDHDMETCFEAVFPLPFKAAKALVKGAARLGKGIYKYFRKGNTSDTSVLLETVMEPPGQAKPFALDEVSVS